MVGKKLTARQLAERDIRLSLREEGKTFINLSQKQWNSYCFYTAYGEFI